MRLNQKEVDRLAAGQILKETVEFPGHTSLSYVLKPHSGLEARALFEDGSIEICAPQTPMMDWIGSDELGLYYSLPAGEEQLKIAIEKDLECLDGPPEEKDPHAFPRELAAKTC